MRPKYIKIVHELVWIKLNESKCTVKQWNLLSMPCLAILKITKRSCSKYEWAAKRREEIKKEYMQVSKNSRTMRKRWWWGGEGGGGRGRIKKIEWKKQPWKKWISFWRKTLPFMCTAFLVTFRSRIVRASGATDEAHIGGVSPSLTTLSPTLMTINGGSTSKYQKQTSCQAHVCCRAANKNRLTTLRQSVTIINMSYKAIFKFLFLYAVLSYQSVLCFNVLVTYLFVWMKIYRVYTKERCAFKS